eukprot:comp24227_c0_seq1/m.44649 comp24227_c0_seq1/g.44649  ORF comp24227_c0_seq1/g.44649 comp24227_c0_seq1/m.44649 type:complete len:1428 (-) comp24227_c0_seq1:888-5171(-)
MRLWAILALGLAGQRVGAVPWHTVNDFDDDGQVCKLMDVKQDCPSLCVRDLADCPASFGPASCPQGTVLCPDGKCHNGTANVCTNIKNECACVHRDQIPRPADDEFLSCRREIVMMGYYDVVDADKVNQACAGAYGVPHKPLTSEKADAGATQLLLNCTLAVEVVDFTDPGFIATYVIFGTFGVLLLIWAVFKWAVERSVIREDHMRELRKKRDHESQATEMGLMGEENIELRQRGLRNHWFGQLLVFYIAVLSFGWFIVMALLTYDYYHQGDDHIPIIYSNDEILSAAFVAVWHLCVFWFFALKGFETTIRNFFRLRTPIHKAQFVEIWRRRDHAVMLADASAAIRLLAWLRDKRQALFGADGVLETVEVRRTDKDLPYFVYECIHYSYQPASGEYERIKINLGSTYADILTHTGGLSTEEAKHNEQLVGLNFIPVVVPSVPVAVFQEFMTIFYLYQFMMLWVWYYFAYWQVGLTLTVVIIVSGLIKVYYKQVSQKKIKAMAEHSDMCRAWRNGCWEALSTMDLVPGDVVLLAENHTVPCDGVVISGSCVLDESMLTGESMPVQKTPIKADGTQYDKHGAGKKHTLFAGTRVLSAQPHEGETEVRMLVLATGAATDKGSLIQHILFPSPIFFIFDEHLKIVVGILLTWGAIAFVIMVAMMNQGNVYSWFYGMMTISQTMHPMLPAVLVIGQTVAAKRLVERSIYCTNFQRIAMAGKLQVFCFDKTGTLTRDGLNFYGIHPVGNRQPAEFRSAIYGSESLPIEMQRAMAVAHSVTQLAGQLVGNPVDVEMFGAVRWGITVGEYVTVSEPNGREALRIVRAFEFDHGRQCMTAVAVDPATGEVHVYAKGSFEKVKAMSRPDSVPADYDAVASGHAQEGCYTLGFAHRSVGRVDVAAIKSMSREEIESGLEFLGLIMFRNLLKDDTADAIAQLKKGSVRPVMITGDNALTAVHIARECRMLATPTTTVLLGDLSRTEPGKIRWVRLDRDEEVDVEQYINRRPIISTRDTFGRLGAPKRLGGGFGATGPKGAVKLVDEDDGEVASAVEVDMSESGPVELAVTGPAFRLLLAQRLMQRYLMHTRIFARMTPHQKVQCVQLFMERGVTGMCGDGGNDCGALRAAHVGVALSDAEASIVSPFSSRNHSIQSCVALVSEGRAALATSFSSYKFLVMYGEILVFQSFTTAYFMIQFWWWAWVFLDVFIVIPISYALSLSRPRAKLAKYRPTARLLGLQTVVSACAMTFFNGLFQVLSFVLLFNEPWFKCHEFDGNRVDIERWWEMGDNYEAEVTAIMTIFQMIAVPFALNFGSKFRRPWYYNYLLVFLLSAYFSVMAVALLADPNPLGCFFHINCGTPDALASLGYSASAAFNIDQWYLPGGHNIMPTSFRYKLFALVLGNIAVVWAFEAIVVLGPVRSMLRRKVRGPQKQTMLM